MRHFGRSAAFIGLLSLLVSPSFADTITLAPTQDASLFAPNGNNASGSSGFLYVGQAAVGPRRALLQFDIAGNIPAGSTINSVELEMAVTRLGPLAQPTQNFTLQRATVSWGEGASDSGNVGGLGVAAATDDATWTERFFGQSLPWTTVGGDFAAGVSGTVAAPTSLTTFSFPSQAGMVADVQNWLDTPSGNFGWMMRGNELTARSARQLSSREGATPPQLTIDFDPPVTPVPGVTPIGMGLLALGLLMAMTLVTLWMRRRGATPA